MVELNIERNSVYWIFENWVTDQQYNNLKPIGKECTLSRYFDYDYDFLFQTLVEFYDIHLCTSNEIIFTS